MASTEVIPSAILGMFPLEVTDLLNQGLIRNFTEKAVSDTLFKNWLVEGTGA